MMLDKNIEMDELKGMEEMKMDRKNINPAGNKVELLAPAGNLEKMKMAILYGADAV